MSTKEIKINRFDTISEETRDLPNGQFRYLENVNTGDFGHSAKQIPNIYTKDNDHCILKLIKYNNTIYGLGYENSTTKDVTLYQYDQNNNVYNALTNGTVAGGTLRLYNPLLAVMDGFIYFDPGTNYVARYEISTNTMSATWHAHNGGMSGGTQWQGKLYCWSDYDNEIYAIDGSDLTSMIKIPDDQTVVEQITYGNYLEIICTASTKSDDGVSRMYTWDGVTTTTFAEIVDIGYGAVSGGDVLDGIIYAVIGFVNRKGFRIKAYTGGVFQTTYTYYGKKNEVSNYVYCQPASSVKAYTGYLYFMVVGARPGSTFAPVYEMVLFRYGKNNIGQGNKLSVYKSLDVIPGVGNTLTTVGNDFIVSEEVNPAEIVDNSIYAVVYEALYKTRQCYIGYTPTYGSQPGIIETAIFTLDGSDNEKKLLSTNIQFKPLTTGQSITLKYKADDDVSWTTISTASEIGSVDYDSINIESTGDNLPIFNEIAFRIELLGGAELTGFKFKAEEMNDIYG